MDFDELKKQAEGLVSEHPTEVKQGVEKAAELLKGQIGHDEQVDDAAGKLEGFLAKE